jgi:hypothetical protein
LVDGTTRVQILPTDAATRDLLKNFVTIDSPLAGVDSPASAAERTRLCENFTRHGLTATVVDNENVLVQGCVTVRPPYRPQDTRATNEIVLERVVKLMKSFS